MSTQLEQKLDYAFQDKSLLETALTHSSASDTKSQNYERLEFLGDRVLGLAIAGALYKKFPDEAEGDLAKRHAALVQKKALYKVAQGLELGNFLSLSDNESETGGRKKETILADVVESLFGAIYLEAGYDRAEKVVLSLFEGLITTQEAPPQDPKTKLQEYVQSKNQEVPTYLLKKQTGPSHSPTFVMEVHVHGFPIFSGKAHSKRVAEKQAAQLLLDYIEKQKKEIHD